MCAGQCGWNERKLAEVPATHCKCELPQARISTHFSDKGFCSSQLSFPSAGVLKKDESHLSPVVSILPIVMPGDRSVMCT